MKLVHLRDNCIGCGVCVEEQPEHWEMEDKDGKANLIRSQEKRRAFVKTIFDFEKEKSIVVCNACPVNCIKLEE